MSASFDHSITARSDEKALMLIFCIPLYQFVKFSEKSHSFTF